MNKPFLNLSVVGLLAVATRTQAQAPAPANPGFTPEPMQALEAQIRQSKSAELLYPKGFGHIKCVLDDGNLPMRKVDNDPELLRYAGAFGRHHVENYPVKVLTPETVATGLPLWKADARAKGMI